MRIGRRLRDIREAKNLSQGDIERATGLVRPYISRVENGHPVPSIETLQKWASALGMRLYQVLYQDEEPPKLAIVPTDGKEHLWGDSGTEAQELGLLRQYLEKMNQRGRKTLLAIAAQMARRSRAK